VQNKTKVKELVLKLRKEPSRKVERRRKSKPMLRARKKLKKAKMLMSRTRISSLERKMIRMNSNLSLVFVREVFKLFSQLRMIRKLNSRKSLLKILITQRRIQMVISTCFLRRIT
jgi:hypothetical protein